MIPRYKIALQLSGGALGFGALQLSLAAPALAQDADRLGDNVLTREQARLEEGGIRAGSFVIRPVIDADLIYNDNILADATQRDGDFIGIVRPQIEVESDWAVHQLELRGSYQRSAYFENPSEDASEFTLAAAGRLDISSDTRLNLDADYRRQAEQRADLGSIRATAERARLSSAGLRARLSQRFGRFALAVEGRASQWTYDDVALSNGQTLDQTFRDFTLASGSVQAGYYVSPLTQVFARVSYEARRYDLRPGEPGFDPLTGVDRSADSTRFEIGLQRELNELITATVRVGYLDFAYPDPTVQDVEALSYFAAVRWNPTALTTVTLDAQRSLDESVSPNTAGNLRDELRLAVDHELLRQLIVGLRGRLAWVDPAEATGIPAIGNTQDREIAFEARYYLANRIRLRLNLSHTTRNSDNNNIFDFRANAASLSVGYAF